MKTARSFTGKFPQFTPQEQLIRTADISCDGFRTPRLSNNNQFEAVSYLDSPFLNSPFVNKMATTDPFDLSGDEKLDCDDEIDESAAEVWFSKTGGERVMVSVKLLAVFKSIHCCCILDDGPSS